MVRSPSPPLPPFLLPPPGVGQRWSTVPQTQTHGGQADCRQTQPILVADQAGAELEKTHLSFIPPCLTVTVRRRSSARVAPVSR